MKLLRTRRVTWESPQGSALFQCVIEATSRIGDPQSAASREFFLLGSEVDVATGVGDVVLGKKLSSNCNTMSMISAAYVPRDVSSRSDIASDWIGAGFHECSSRC
jgi:hypothetical protein